MLKLHLRMKRFFNFILISLLISCGTEYKIKPESFEWQPYEIGDKLVFESHSKQIDTVFVNEISDYTNPNDPLAVFPNYHTTYFVSGEISLLNPFTSSTGNKIFKDYVDLLALRSGKTTDYLTLNFAKRRDTLLYPEITLKISELKSKFENKSKYESIEIDIESYNNLPFSYEVKTILWSKEFGYTGYKFKNGNSWRLIKFIRNGKDILKK